VFVPVRVTVGVVETVPLVGETDSVGVATVIVLLLVPSLTLSVPVPDPVVMTTVAVVGFVIFL